MFNQNQFIEVKIIKHFVNEAEDPSFIKKRESNDSRKHLLSPRILKKSSKKQNTQSVKNEVTRPIKKSDDLLERLSKKYGLDSERIVKNKSDAFFETVKTTKKNKFYN